MPNALRIVVGLVVIAGLGFGLRYLYEDTMTKATTMKPADLGINEANGWKPVELKFAPIDTTPMKPFEPVRQFPSRR